MKLHKNFLICLLAAAAVLLCLVALPQTAHAASTSDLTFTLNATGDGYLVSKCNTSASGSLTIPASYNGKPVTGIGDSAFSWCTSLTNVTIPDSVTSIGYLAFNNCQKLTSFTIPNSVTSIGNRAFFSCTSLTSITISDSVTTIEDSAFSCCTSLTSITIPDSVTSIGDNAFNTCESLTSITIPDSVTSIGFRAFYYCTKLTSITIGNGVTSIGERAFDSCYSLTSLNVAEGNTTYHSTGNCIIQTETKKLVAGCQTSQIPADGSVTSIGNQAFYYCYELASITIPDSVTSIGDQAFYQCGSLTSVTIPDSVISIGDCAFHYCNSLSEVIYCGTQEQWDAIEIGGDNECLTNANLQLHNMEDGVCTICGYGEPAVPSVLTFTLNESGDGYIVSDCDTAATGDLVIPAIYQGLPVTAIGKWALAYCNNLTSVTIPESVTTIGDYSFKECDALTSITISRGVISIGHYAFLACYALTDVIISDTVTTIGTYAFKDCDKLTSITMPDSVTSIGNFAFSDSPIKKLTIAEGSKTITSTMVVCKTTLEEIVIPNSVESIEAGAFKLCDNVNYKIDGDVKYLGNDTNPYVVLVGATTKTLSSYNIHLDTRVIYASAFSSCTNLESITIPSGVTSIGNSAFSSCSSLTNIAIPDSVTSMGSALFSGCTNLVGVNIPSSVTSIDGVFYNCTGLTDITIPDSVTTIGDSAFKDCTSLESITIPASVTRIGDDAFYGCYNLTSITIPDSVTSIGSYAFSRCYDLTGITIPDSVTSISDSAFYYCSSLTNVTIGDGVSCIGKSMFKNCTSLTDIIIPSGITGIDNGAFKGCTNLKSIIIPDSVTSIGSIAFSGCAGLTNVIYCGTQEAWDAIEIGDSNDPLHNATLQFHSFENGICTLCGEIGVMASGTCGNNLTWKLHGNGTLRISGSGAMNNVTTARAPWYSYSGSIVRVVIDEGCTTIGNYAFYDCSKLASITIPDSVTSIGNHAFSNCTGLTGITLPDSVTSIGEYAFHMCENLTSIVIPKGLTSIANYTFNWCTGLTSVTIHSGVTKIGEGGFSNCTGVVDVYIEDIASWCKISFTYKTANPIRYAKNLFINGELVTDLTIPRSVTKISDYAFYGFTGLNSITVSDSLTNIGSDAFTDCNIKKLIIAEGTQEITRNMVMCEATLEEIVIPDSVTTIGFEAFKSCSSLTRITIPDGVTSIGGDAFSGCSSLTSINIPDGVTSISSDTFYGCKSLTSIHIPDGVTHIWDYAFAYSGLTSINIPDSVTTIGKWAFTGCTALEDVYITDASAWCKITFTKYQTYHVSANPLSGGARLHIVDAAGNEVTQIVLDDTVTTIPYRAFSNCINLTDITIPDSVTSIDSYAFEGCVGLTNITIPDRVASIGTCAFANCTGLTQLTVDEGNRTYHSEGNCIIETGNKKLIAGCQNSQIPSDGSVTSIDNSAFNGCTDLTSIAIPGSVTSIGKSAFNGCAGLTNVIYCGTQESWDAIEMGDSNDPLRNATLQFHSFENGICTLCGEIGVMASGTCGENLTWELYGDGALVIDGTGEMKDYYFHFMNQYEADPPPWYDLLGMVKNIIFRSGVTRIGAYAFYGCPNLESVTMPASIESIGMCAFTGCKNKFDVYIADLAAWFNIDFEYYYYPEGPAGPNANPLKWGGKLHLNGEQVIDLVIPDGVTTIKYCALYFGTFNSITIPSSVQTIENVAFYDCNVKSVVIPASVTKIGAGAFGSCSVKEITYCGTQAQWDAITIGSDNEPLLTATLQFHDIADNGICAICGGRIAGEMDGNEGVDCNDAIYLLLNILFGDDVYPLNGANADVDGNGVVELTDAIYLLLYALFGGAFYPLKA